MKKFLLATLLCLFPANAYASLDIGYAKKGVAEIAKIAKKHFEEQQAKKNVIKYNENTKLFLDGKRIYELPPSKGVKIHKVVVDEDDIALEIYFVTEA